MTTTREDILNSIINISKKNTNEIIEIKKKELVFQNSKYSSTKKQIWHVVINGTVLRKTSDYLISYECINCKKNNTVSTTQFLRKIRQCKDKCFQCQLSLLNNTPNHNIPKNTEKIKLTFKEIYEKSLQEFDNLSDEYKNSYFLKHLTEDDYIRIRPKIISICNGKYTNIEHFQYWSVFKTNNQMLYTSVLYDSQTDTVIKQNQPIVKCDNCECTWRAKSIECFKNCYKLLCPTCKLCNRTFKIRPTKNINNETIIYQSKLEKKFIDWCYENNILCNNGPTIEYFWNGKSKKYRIDFQVDKLLIEVKDFHIWHKKQIENGIWKEKVSAVDELIKNKLYKQYLLITPQNWKEVLDTILECIK